MEFFRKLSRGVKITVGIILGIIGSFFLLNKREQYSEKKIDDSRKKIDIATGENNVLEQNQKQNSKIIKNIDVQISEVHNNIEEIKEEKNNEKLDDFFDKRGF